MIPNMTWLEYIGLSAVCVVGLGLASLIVYWFQALLLRRAETIREDQNDWLTTRLMADSWWFSEDKATTFAIQGVLKRREVSQLREDWRRLRRGEVDFEFPAGTLKARPASEMRDE